MDECGDLRHLLERTAPFSGFSTQERDALESKVLVRAYPAGTVVLEQGHESGNDLYLVLAGQLRLVESAPGGVTRKFGVGKLFGSHGLLRDGPLPYQAETLTDAKLALLPADVFHDLCDRHPRVRAFFESDLRAYTRHHVTHYDLSGAQFLFGTRLSDLIHRAAPRCSPGLSVRDAAELMNDQHCDVLVVMHDDAPIGLLTDRDLRARVVATAASPDTPVRQVMTRDVNILSARNSLFEALLMMLEKGCSHVLVRASGNGPLLGVVNDTDIARAHGYSPMLLLDQISRSSHLENLTELRGEANRQLLQLYRRGVRAQDLITINTLINDALTRRVLDFAEDEFAASRPVAQFHWAWLSMGSEGRGEMSLKTDQDNALVYDAPAAVAPQVEEWLARWAGQVNQNLDRIGLSLCQGGMMAGNPSWRHSLERWATQFDDWLARSEAMHIMQVAAACDLRLVHGDMALEEPVKKSLMDALLKHPRFLRHMARGVIAERPPVGGLFGRIRSVKTEEGRKINIKRRGLQPITDFARVLSLQRRYLESSNTFDRFDFLLQAEPKLESTLQDALTAYRHLNDIRLGQHLYDANLGRSRATGSPWTN